MATLGNVPAEAYTNTVKDSFSGNGSATAFTMSLPTVTNDVRVVVENVIQDPTVAYSVSGTTLTFTSAPPTGTNNIYVVHLGPAVMTTVPPAEIADATTFASSLTVQGAFTSPGIDDNGNATAMTIDSNENVLITKTATGIATVGSELKATGELLATVNNDACAFLNRKSSDGDIINLRKDGTTVGSIGTHASNITIGTGATGLRFYDTDNVVMPRNPSTGASVNGTISLGEPLNRFKDAYLSGGIYLGGTGSANKLEDYEEGTWTLTQGAQGTWNSPTFVGKYTKIGQLVTVTMEQNAGTISYQKTYYGGLPFPVSTTSHGYKGVGGASNGNIDDLGGIMAFSGTTQIYVLTAGSNQTNLIFSITYHTDS